MTVIEERIHNILAKIPEKTYAQGKAFVENKAVHDLVVDKNCIFAKIKKGQNRFDVVLRIKSLAKRRVEELQEILLQEQTAHTFWRMGYLEDEFLLRLEDKLSTKLFPTTPSGCPSLCICDADGDFCSHAAAALLTFLEEVKKKPGLLLDLRGIAAPPSGITSTQKLAQKWPIEVSAPQKITVKASAFSLEDIRTPPVRKAQIQALLGLRDFFTNKKFRIEEFLTHYWSCHQNLLGTRSLFGGKKRQKLTSSPFWLILSPDGHMLGIHTGKGLAKKTTFAELIKRLLEAPEVQLRELPASTQALAQLAKYAAAFFRAGYFAPELVRYRDGFTFRFTPARLLPDLEAFKEKFISQFPCEMVLLMEGHEGYRQAENPQEVVWALCSACFEAFLNELAPMQQGGQTGMLFSHEGGPVKFALHNLNLTGQTAYGDASFWNEIGHFLQENIHRPHAVLPLLRFQEFQDEDDETQLRANLVFALRDSAFSDYFSPKETLAQSTAKAAPSQVAFYITQVREQLGLDFLQHNKGIVLSLEEYSQKIEKKVSHLECLGFALQLPQGLKEVTTPKLDITLRSKTEIPEDFAFAELQDLLGFQWQVDLNGTKVGIDEFLAALKKSKSAVVQIKGRYLKANDLSVNSIQHRYKSLFQENPDVNLLLRTGLSAKLGGEKVRVSTEVQNLLQRLMTPAPVELPEGLQAELRPYQLRGYGWLYQNARVGFGSLLADDMGLGKTLQTICLLLKIKQEGQLGSGQKALVVAPASLLTNWQAEVERFAPALLVNLYHGSNRNAEGEYDLMLTSYGTARSDASLLAERPWKALILDESQNIKNHNTEQAKTIRQLKADIRIALSGTPVENSLSEYWSVFNFINPEYLGRIRDFRERFAKPIENQRDKKALEDFKKITGPFILRRVKSDPQIAKELPAKKEQDAYCALTASQKKLYEKTVAAITNEIKATEGIQRKGLVLKLITALKQICNHPAHYSPATANAGLKPEHSGKAALLLSLLEQVREGGEKALIFTQYRKMGDLLVEMLGEKFGVEVPFLHGGCSRTERDRMIKQFTTHENIPFFILSIKAGGVGLNLTEANHVFHYDLWWNPAVERQATDRAYRIGQEQDVWVHRLITRETFEEKINAMLRKKQELADLAVTKGETWVTEMDDKELLEVFKLSH